MVTLGILRAECNGAALFQRLGGTRAHQKARPTVKPSSKRGTCGSAKPQEPLAQGGAFLPTDIAFKSLILTALKDIFGQLNCTGYPVDVLSWDPVTGKGRLRIPSRCDCGCQAEDHIYPFVL